MKKLKYEFEVVKYPLIILLVMTFLQGLSNTFFASPLRDILSERLAWIIPLMAVVQFFSAIVILYFPFLLIIKLLGTKHDSYRVVLMYVVSYVLLLVITLVLGKPNFAEIAYQDLFTISAINRNNLFTLEVLTRPYRLGIIGATLSGLIVHYSFKRTRTRTKYSFLPFIDRDALSLIFVIAFTLIIGTMFTFIWQYFIGFLFKVFSWISDDITNPVSMFIYGILDRLLSLLGISEINRETFWYTNMGGTWMSSANMSFSGDVSIWQESIKYGIYESGFGRFITPYYLTNLFIIPAVIVSIISLYSNKRERLAVLSVGVLMLVLSFFSELLLPFEILLIVMSPLLYIIHIFIVGSLFAILQAFRIFLGSNFIFDLNKTSLGNGYEFISFLKNEHLSPTVLQLITIGLALFVLYYILVRIYYKYLAVGLINKFEITSLTDEFLEIVGGLENIEKIHANPFRVEVELVRPQLFNYEKLNATNISRAIETQTTYAIYYGSSSVMIREEVVLRKKLFEK